MNNNLSIVIREEIVCVFLRKWSEFWFKSANVPILPNPNKKARIFEFAENETFPE